MVRSTELAKRSLASPVRRRRHSRRAHRTRFIEPLEPRMLLSVSIYTPMLFASLDGSTLDDDGLINGVFTVNGDLTLFGGGRISADDNGATSASPIRITVSGNMLMHSGSAITAENNNAGGSGANIDLVIGGRLAMLGSGGGGAIISSSKNAGAGDTGRAGNITIQAGDNIDLDPGTVITADSTGPAGAITITGHMITVNGLVSSYGRMTGTGKTQAPGGGPITIKAGTGSLLIGDSGVVSSKGIDPGADLVHLEGENVTIWGLVESTGHGHAIPNNPPNRLGPPYRYDKPANSTAGVEIWAANVLTIDRTGSHRGEINADTAQAGGTKGLGWIDLFALGDIHIIGGLSGPFAVHANQFVTNAQGGLITIKSLQGSVNATGLAVQADASTAGGSGGQITIEAKANVNLDAANIVFARGDYNPSGGLGGGGQLLVRAYDGGISWTYGVGDVRPTGTGGSTPIPASDRGVITLIYNTSIDLTGTTFPYLGSPTTPSIVQDTSGGAPTVPPYVEFLCRGGPGASSLSGFVYYDANNNGIKQTGEPGIGNVQVILTGIDNQGAVVNLTTTTAPDGSYSFINLQPGIYTIFESQPAGYLDGKDTIGTPGGLTANDLFFNIILPANFAGVNNNFGELLASSLSGRVFVDRDGDCIQQPGEPPIPAVQINLTGVNDLGQPVALTTYTNSFGQYSFTNLRPGVYVITEVQPAGYLDGGEKIGTPGGLTSDDMFYNIRLPAGFNGVENNFCEILPGPGINIEKLTNGQDADLPTGPEIPVGGLVTWTYVVTNTGNVPLGSVVVVDNQGVVPAYVSGDVNGNGLLDLTETWVYTATGIAVRGQYANVATVTARDPSNILVTDDDPSHYLGVTGQPPTIGLVKTANKSTAAPFEPVTFTYLVTNPGGVALANVLIVDDNGTPDFAGDDFSPTFVSGDVNANGLLDPGELWTYTATVLPPIQMCMIVDGASIQVATLIVQLLPSGDVQVDYRQSRNVVDNTYGANTSPGYSKTHEFNSMVGSDKAEFRFVNGDGQTVLDFYVDYITGSSAFPSGYGSLGVAGGDGKMVTGSAASVLTATTTLTTNLNQSPAYYGFTKDSPAEPNPNWDYVNGYTVVIKGAAFGPSGFSQVMIPEVHNSPSKLGFNRVTPRLCPGPVTNRAVVTATADGALLTASAEHTVQIQLSPAKLVASNVTVKDKKLLVSLTNTGMTDAVITKLQLTWPSSNKKLNKIKLDGDTIFDKDTAPPSVVVTTFKGGVDKRTILAGQTLLLEIEFESKASLNLGDYQLSLNFNGTLLTIL